MSLNVCAHCTTKFSIGALHCPQCGNADYYEEGSMPKITRHGGPSYVGEFATGGEVPADAPLVVDAAAVESADGAPPANPYEGLLRADLQKLLGDRGLPTSGNKEELVARLMAADAEDEESDEESDEGE